MPAPPSDKQKLVTSQLFESYLACPTKCYLQSVGEVPAGSDFTIWSETRYESYRFEGLQRLTADHSQTINGGEQDPRHWKHALWHFAFNQIVRAQNYEAHLYAIQRVQLEGSVQSSQFIPVRFVPANKLSRSDKLMAGFDAFVLAKALGTRIGMTKIIHGDTRAGSICSDQLPLHGGSLS
jgi:hypothetical protein